MSMGNRFVVSDTLPLDDDDPTRYLYNGNYVDLEQHPTTVTVKQEDILADPTLVEDL